MPIYASDADPKNCPICNAELFSVNTKRIGNLAVCRDCYVKLVEAWNEIGDGLVEIAKKRGINNMPGFALGIIG